MENEWQNLTWGDLATLEYGKALREYKSGKYPVYGTNGAIGFTEKPLYDAPSVIVGRKGAYRGIHYSPTPFFVIDTAFYLKPKINFSIKWAYYQLLTQDINGLDSGSAIPSTTRDSFYRLPVSTPPLPTQKAIAHILGTLDDKMELLRSMNETLEAMARALFKSWFVDFDPVRKKAEGQPTGLPPDIDALFPDSIEDSELGEIPQGWKTKPLDEIASFLNGIAGQKYPPKSDGTDIPVIKIAQVRVGNTSSADMACSDIPTDYIVDNGDILFPWSGSLMVSIWNGGKGLLNQHIFKVTSEYHHDWFLYYWIDYYMEYFQGIASDKATTMGHIQRGHLSRTKVLVPSPTIEKWMNTIIDPLFREKHQNMLEVNNLINIRDALLPKLISGELELSDQMIKKILEPVK